VIEIQDGCQPRVNPPEALDGRSVPDLKPLPTTSLPISEEGRLSPVTGGPAVVSCVRTCLAAILGRLQAFITGADVIRNSRRISGNGKGFEMISPSPPQRITKDRFDAVLFDLDGVLTATARTHAASWKAMFDTFLEKRAKEGRRPFHPFDIISDYQLYVDGKLRYEGVQSFLKSRSIELPRGVPDDPPGYDTVCGLGNLKDELVKQAIEEGPVETYPGAVALARHVLALGMKTAVVSASKNCQAVLMAANIEHLFPVRVDGEVAERLQIAGKPAPDTFLRAAAMLEVDPRRAVVVEDAISGVAAGRAGGFGLVIGVDRKGSAAALLANGADLVVTDLGELIA